MRHFTAVIKFYPQILPWKEEAIGAKGGIIKNYGFLMTTGEILLSDLS